MKQQYRLASAIAAALTVSTGAAIAAEMAAGSLEEIVVTATKRAESEQSVPLSMTTFGGFALQEKAIETFFDYATKVPNLAFAQTGDGVGTSRTISIRGISGDNVTAVYVDDTPLPDSIDPRVLDIDHIEVLRGPQGDLYGARSMGGTVRMVTKTADFNNTTATVHAGIGKTAQTDRPNDTADVVINLPLIEGRMALRVSAFYDTEAGYFTRSYCTDPSTAGVSCFPLSKTGVTRLNNIGEIDTYGASASLAIKVTDDLIVTPKWTTQRADYNGFPMVDFLSTPGNGYGYPVPSPPSTNPVPLPTVMEPGSFNQARLFNIAEGGSDSWDLFSLTVNWNTDVGQLVSSSSYFDRYVYETEDESDFVWADITSNCTAGAVSAGNCNAVGSAQPGAISELKDYQRFAQEVRWTSSLKGPFNFVLGGFYSDFHGRLPYSAYYPAATVPGLDNTLAPPPYQPITPGYPNTVFVSDFHTDIQEPALFGNVNLTWDKWKVTAGLRWYQVKESSYGYEGGLATGGGPLVVSPYVKTTENGVNPKVEVDYHVNPDQMVYATASKGFRPGGLVPLVPAGLPGTGTDCVAALKQQDPNLSLSQTREYNSDSLWNYELGAKTAWLDHRLTVNASGFYINWKNIQQEVLLSCGFQFVANAGSATSKGGELEVRARATEALELSAGVGYQNAKITDQGVGPQPVGSPVFNVPDWTANGSATYTVPVNDAWNFVSNLDYSYMGRSYSANNSPSDPRERPSYRLINARFALERGPLQIALVGKNLADELTNLGDSRSLAAETPGRPRLFVNQPRTIGIEFRESF